MSPKKEPQKQSEEQTPKAHPKTTDPELCGGRLQTPQKKKKPGRKRGLKMAFSDSQNTTSKHYVLKEASKWPTKKKPGPKQDPKMAFFSTQNTTF